MANIGEPLRTIIVEPLALPIEIPTAQPATKEEPLGPPPSAPNKHEETPTVPVYEPV